jgi:hypothetical protein
MKRLKRAWFEIAAMLLLICLMLVPTFLIASDMVRLLSTITNPDRPEFCMEFDEQFAHVRVIESHHQSINQRVLVQDGNRIFFLDIDPCEGVRDERP